ncbi:HDIG domain-containing protein [bacterium]|nr:HDIG domain-containing protein [bacterium]
MTDKNKQHGTSLEKGIPASWRLILIGALFYLIALGIIYGYLYAWPREYKEGQIVPYTIFAPVTVEYLDQTELALLTGRMSDSPSTIIIDSSKKDESLARLQQFRADFNTLRQRLIQQDWSDEEEAGMIATLASKYNLRDTAVIIILMGFSDERLNTIFAAARSQLEQTMDQGVNDAYLRTLKQGGVPELASTPENIYIYFLIPNQNEFTPPTMADQREELAKQTIEKGSVIITAGNVVDKRAEQQLEAVWPHLLQQNLFRFCGAALVLLALLFWWYVFLQRMTPQLCSTSGVLQLSSLFLLFLVIGLVIGRLPFNFSYYGVTFAAAALATIIVLVFDSTLALYLGLGLGLMLSLALNFGADLMLYTLAGGILPPVFIAPSASRQQQVWFSIALGLFNMLLAATVILVSVQTLHWEVFVIAFLAGFIAAVLALGLLPVVETLTSQLTPGKLFELANPENELLRQLKREAHGTYVHSEMVADLSEEACKEIGLNSLLAKVGALYHDIGKLKRPGFFAENIHDLTKNPHQGLPPETSVKILRDHVSNGIEMAKENKLPVELHQFIKEHHGNYLIRYFFYKAQQLHQENPEEHPEPDKKNFSYSGPIPTSRESGIVMLADVTEAVIRAKGIVEAEEIRVIVDRIVADKIDEEQLIASGLTIGDLQLVKRAFNRILVAQRHQRVRYPEDHPATVQFHYIDNGGPKS